jgi:heat shock protein HslJ
MRSKRFQSTLILSLAALVAVIGLAACASGAEQAGLVGAEWRLASIGGEAVPADVTITATFTEDEVAGSSGCNSYNGPYTVDGDNLEIGPTVSTLMACEEPMMTWEGNYLQALQAAQTYSISGNELEITTEEGVLLFNAE